MIMMSNVIDLNRKFYITLKAATAVVWKVRERAEEQALKMTYWERAVFTVVRYKQKQCRDKRNA